MQNNISIKQNEEKMLKVQFAARIFYNKAENLSYLAFVISFLLMFVIFIPDEYSVWLTKILPFLMQVLCFVILYIRDKYIIKASNLRNYFDYFVLNIKSSNYSNSRVREIYEIAEENYKSRYDEFAIQSQNNGESKQPGVLDWYIIKEENNQIDAIYECQKQNIWWNSKMEKFRFKLYSRVLIFLILVLIMIFVSKGFLEMILSFSAILFLISSQIINWYKYIVISYKISGAVEILDLSRNEDGILILQEYLIELRKINLLHINLIHKKNAEILSKVFKEITF